MISRWAALSPITRLGAVVLALLVVSTAIVFVLKRIHPGKNYRELEQRTNTWWIMAALVFGAVLMPEAGGTSLFALLSFWALKEFVTLLETRPADHKALAAAFLAVPVHYWWIHTDWYGMFIVFIPVYVFLLLPALLVLAKDTAGFIASVSQLQWGLMAFVFGLGHLAYLSRIPLRLPPGVDGRTLLLFLIFTVEISDVLQYVWGKTLGRHKILPAVSPNKTWEGFVLGTLSASAASLVIRFLTPFLRAECFLVALALTFAGFLGGAVMSAVKRDFGVKDFGALIPGHGGVLDRVDSLCYAAPLFFHYCRYVYS